MSSTHTLLEGCSKITGRKGGFSLPVLLFVDILFIFCEASRWTPSPPPSELIYGTCPGRHGRDLFNVVFLAFVEWDNRYTGPSEVIHCLLKIFVFLWSHGWWHRQIGIKFLVYVSNSISIFFFFTLLMLSASTNSFWNDWKAISSLSRFFFSLHW